MMPRTEWRRRGSRRRPIIQLASRTDEVWSFPYSALKLPMFPGEPPDSNDSNLSRRRPARLATPLCQSHSYRLGGGNVPYHFAPASGVTPCRPPGCTPCPTAQHASRRSIARKVGRPCPWTRSPRPCHANRMTAPSSPSPGRSAETESAASDAGLGFAEPAGHLDRRVLAVQHAAVSHGDHLRPKPQPADVAERIRHQPE